MAGRSIGAYGTDSDTHSSISGGAAINRPLRQEGTVHVRQRFARSRGNTRPWTRSNPDLGKLACRVSQLDSEFWLWRIASSIVILEKQDQFTLDRA